MLWHTHCQNCFRVERPCFPLLSTKKINSMIKNYFRIALRNIIRHKGYSIINITGLAIGIAACLLLFLVIRYEMSYDKFQPRYADIYRVVTQDKYPEGIKYNPGVPAPALD